VPLLGRDLHHVVDARVVADLHLGQPEVRTLAGMTGHDVVDHEATVRGCHLTHPPELRFGTEHLVDLGADPVEVPVDARRGLAAEYSARPLQRTGVHRRDADRLERTPQVLVAEGAEEAVTRLRDHRRRIGREPHRRATCR
jgi:hypothetical protein